MARPQAPVTRPRDTPAKQARAARIAGILQALSRHGLLLKQDKRLPSVVTLVTGEALRTSWWSHPEAREIFAILSELSEHPDVLFSKLLLGKDTLVHRRLWPAFLAVARASEGWQRRGLDPAARALLRSVERSRAPVRASGPAVRRLEARLLLRAEEVHTPSGRHEMVVETWASWSERAGVGAAPSAAEGKRALAQAALALGAPLSALPWVASAASPSSSSPSPATREPAGSAPRSGRSRRGWGGSDRAPGGPRGARRDRSMARRRRP